MGELVVAFFAVLLVSGFVAAAIYGWRVPPAASLALLLLATVAHAGEPVPTSACGEPIPGFVPCTLVVSGYAGVGSLWKPGQDRHAVAFSRFQGDLLTGIGHAHLAARIDTSALTDGGATSAPASYQTIEARGALYYPVSPVVSLAAVGGISAPLLHVEGIVQKYPTLVGGGLMLGSPRARTWLFCGAGLDQAAGKGVKFLVAGQIRLKGNTYVMIDGSIGGAGSYFRNGSALGTN